MAGLTLDVGPQVRIPWTGGAGAFAAQLDDGTVVLAGGDRSLCSRDGGNTWQDGCVLGMQFVPCRDGTVIGTAGTAESKGE